MQGAPLVRGVPPKRSGAPAGVVGVPRIGSGGKSVSGGGGGPASDWKPPAPVAPPPDPPRPLDALPPAPPPPLARVPTRAHATLAAARHTTMSLRAIPL